MSQKRFVAHHNVPIQSKISQGIEEKRIRMATPSLNIKKNDVKIVESSRRTPGIYVTVSDTALTKR